MGLAAGLTTQARRDGAHLDAADAVTMETLRHLKPQLPDAGNYGRAVAGALTAEAGLTAARRSETGTAWRYCNEVRRLAGALPAGCLHPAGSFSRGVIGARAVTVAVEPHSGSTSDSVRPGHGVSAAVPTPPSGLRWW